MDSDVVTLGPELLQRHLFHSPAGWHLWRSDWIIANSLLRRKQPVIFLCLFILNITVTVSRYHMLTLMPNDCILEATSFPILPSPTIPSTLPYSSAPMNWKIGSKTMTHLQKSQSTQIQVSHLIIHNWVDNGANHATVMAWCSQCKQPFKQHTGEQAKMLLPSCDPSFLASLTSLLVAHFWKQINVIMEYYCTSITTTELLGNCSEMTWLVLPWEAHEQSTCQLSSTDCVATRRAAEKHSYKVKSVVYWNCTVKKICI